MSYDFPDGPDFNPEPLDDDPWDVRPYAEEEVTPRRYCFPQCRDPFFNECADCWQSGGNPPTTPCTPS